MPFCWIPAERVWGSLKLYILFGHELYAPVVRLVWPLEENCCATGRDEELNYENALSTAANICAVAAAAAV